MGFDCLVLSLKIPNIAKKLEDFKKDVEAKKKPPNDKSWKINIPPVNSVCTKDAIYLSGSKGQVEGWHGRFLHS